MSPESRRQLTFGDAFDVWSVPNVWPDRPIDLRDTWLDYYEAMELLAINLMRLFAIALGVDEHDFDDHITNLCANHSPPVIGGTLPGQFRKGPHSDWAVLRCYSGTTPAALRSSIAGPRDWIDVPVVPGAYVVDTGDRMSG